MAIFYGVGDWPDCKALRLMPETLVAVCHPDLAQGVTGCNIYHTQPLLHIRTRPEAWRKWFEQKGLSGHPAAGMMHDQFSTILQAAAHGQGIALVPDFMAEQDIATGRLVTCGAPEPGVGSYYLVWPKEKSTDPSVVTFIDWITEFAHNKDSRPR